MAEEDTNFAFKDFVWGVATSAYQVEGAWNVGGKAPSIWDDFCRVPGTIIDGSNGEVACDFYHRYEEDIEIARSAGFSHFRLSISWPRVISSDGQPVEEGLSFYGRLFSALHKAGLKACVTLYHWDLPSFLQTEEIPGWMSPAITKHFTAFAKLCFERFSGSVDSWITFNEPAVFLDGYVAGKKHTAPAVPYPDDEALLVQRHVLLAHAETVALFRSDFQTQNGGKIGLTLNMRFFEPVDGSEAATAEAQRLMETRVGCWADPVVTGDFPASYKAAKGDIAALKFSEEEQARLRGSIDFLGINYYTASGVKADGTDGHTQIFPLGPESGAGWLRSYPHGLSGLLRWLAARYEKLDLVITENGYCTAADDPEALDDVERVEYFRQHLAVVKAAVVAGLPLRGYYAWTFLDNFEWVGGYKERFGIVHVDFDKDLKRTPKRSYYWWQQFMESVRDGKEDAVLAAKVEQRKGDCGPCR
mmetsp:Transcript_28671/g.58643  ORF Transcript_28671/g.58643 Transcript_28671/m.58643 type:complete len:474 (-) Transcript_28671:156-1577(-)